MEKIATYLKAPQKSTPKWEQQSISAFTFKPRTLYQQKEIFFKGLQKQKKTNQPKKPQTNKSLHSHSLWFLNLTWKTG